MPVRVFFALCVFGFGAFVCDAQRLTPLSEPPYWEQLNRFQQTITHDEFVALLDSVYAPDHGNWIQIAPGEVTILENAADRFVLRFAESAETRRPVPRYWTCVSALNRDDQNPL